jgi:methionine-S-sulfoxide reductase
VIATRTGFMGGSLPHPTYEQVCEKTTGHAETVEVVYDCRQLPTRALLTDFFTLHDFEQDRRENGGQYRSVIFLDPESKTWPIQEKSALKIVDQLRQNGYAPATVISRETAFYPAGNRHQQYCSARGIVPKKRESAKIREILTP